MLVLAIIWSIVAVIVYVCAGLVCGRICVDIVREKNSNANEVLWFWCGFFFNIIAIFATIVTNKNKNNP